MNDCLLTQLKASVNNDGLSKLGILTLKVTPQTIANTNQQRFGFRASNGKVVTLKAYGGYFATTPQNIEVDKLTTRVIKTADVDVLYFKNAEYHLEVENKYGLTILRNAGNANSIVSINIDELPYCDELTQLSVNNSQSVGNITSIKNLIGLTILSISNTNIEGDIANLSSLVSLTELGINTPGVYGDCVALKNMTSLRNLSVRDGVYGNIVNLSKCISLIEGYVNLSMIEGTLESLADGMVSNGRTSGTCVIYGNGIITYNGTPFTGSKTITFANGTYSIS